MMGPWAYVQHLASTPRLPFTAAYFGSLGLTLYFSIGVSATNSRSALETHRPQNPNPRLQLQSTILTLFAGLAQLASLIWYLVSYFPMGSSGLRMVSSFGARRAAAWMTS